MIISENELFPHLECRAMELKCYVKTMGGYMEYGTS